MGIEIRLAGGDRHQVTPPTDVEKAERFAVSSLALAVAKGIRSGEVEVGMISPLLLSLERMSGPLQGGAPELMDQMRREWDREHLADVDVDRHLRAFAKDVASPKPGIDRAGLSVLKGPATEAPVPVAGRGIER